MGIIIILFALIVSTIASENFTTIRVCDKKPEKHYFFGKGGQDSVRRKISDLQLYYKNNCTEILQMSNFPSSLYFSNNGLVHSVVDAYNQHHNLVLRPDDIWAAIMTQFSFYVNKHAEEFRGKFVDFEGVKELAVQLPGYLRTAPYDLFVKKMTKKIDEHLIDPEVKQWILPNFSTTTENDIVSVGVVFMATMKKYFSYGAVMMCGIPSVTLDGTIDDWKDIYRRIKKLKEYKLTEWHDMLKPILRRFVRAKQGQVDLKFWNRMVDYHGGSGPRSISGWITTFCAFDVNGNWQDYEGKWYEPGRVIRVSDIPSGIVTVPVKINEYGQEHKSIMFAGHMGAEIKNGGDTLQPMLGWVIALSK